MKVLSIIPARGGSKRIPRKNLIKINGKSMLEYTVTSSLNSKLVDRTIVCTEDNEIAREAMRIGSEVVIRPPELATDTILAEQSIQFVLGKLKNDEGYVPDIILLLQNTSPLRNATDIDGAIKTLLQGFDSVLTGFSIHTYFWKQCKKTIKPLNYNIKKRPKKQKEREKILQENGALFATTYSAFMKSKCRISGRIGFYRMPIDRSYNIDTPEDLKELRKYFKK